MKGNLFSNIYKFKQSKVKSPLEDYCTEIFVYIFRQLLKSKDNVSYKLLKIFGFDKINEMNLSNIEVITREYHWVNERRVIPDILLVILFTALPDGYIHSVVHIVQKVRIWKKFFRRF